LIEKCRRKCQNVGNNGVRLFGGGIAVLFSSKNEQRQAEFSPRTCREEGLH